jgi:hypothetical protein
MEIIKEINKWTYRHSVENRTITRRATLIEIRGGVDRRLFAGA